MDSARSKKSIEKLISEPELMDVKKELIKYFRSLGIEVYTNTKARGHQGFFLGNRIDISKETKEEKFVPTLIHEFAHFIHNKIEPEMLKTGGSIEILFNLEVNKVKKEIVNPKKLIIKNIFGCFSKQNTKKQEDIQYTLDLKFEQSFNYKLKSEIQMELLAVTNFVDKSSHMIRLHEHKDKIKRKIKSLESIIKHDYPKFLRSKKFKEFDKYIKKSNAKYLLKYDRIKFITPFLRREEFYSIDTIERDFPDMPEAFCAYIRLKSNMRKQSRISKRLNHLNKYYSKPTELFARFIEGLYIDEAKVQILAPISTKVFYKLLDEGYYLELKNVFEFIQRRKAFTASLGV